MIDVDGSATRTRPRERRDVILRAAAELFRERGYHAVGIDDIGEAVGITGPAVYRHFASKEDLLLTTMQRNVDATLEAIAHIDPRAPGALDEMIRALITCAFTEWDFSVVFRREVSGLPPERRAEISPMRRRIMSRVAEAASVANPELGDIDQLLRLEAQYGLLTGVLFWANPAHRRRYEPVIARMATRSLIARDVPAVALRRLPLLPTGRSNRSSRRETVLAAAVELFASSSFPTIGIDDAGVAAGISGPSVYRHFANKEALLAEAMQRMADVLAVTVAGVLAIDAPAHVRLEFLTARFVEVAHHNPDLLVLFLNGGHYLTGGDKEAYDAAIGMVVDEWNALVQAVRPELASQTSRAICYAVLGATARVLATPALRPYDLRPALRTILMHHQLDDIAD